MPYQERALGNVISAVANSNLSTSQFCAVKAVANTTQPPGWNMDLQTASNAILGILQDNPILGQVGGVQVLGTTFALISPSQAVTGGTTYLEVDSSLGVGSLRVHASGTIVALAMESLASNTTYTVISVELLPSNATQ
jgi:hypothetical protein